MVSDLTICENSILKTLDYLENILRQVNSSLTIANNKILEDVEIFDYLIHAGGDMVFKSGGEKNFVQCKNLILLGGNLMHTRINIYEEEAFQILRIED